MPTHAAVARGYHRRAVGAPDLDDPIDRGPGKVRPVREDDDRRFGLGRQRVEAGTQRYTGSSLPVARENSARVGLHVIRAEHDDHVVYTARSNPLEDAR